MSDDVASPACTECGSPLPDDDDPICPLCRWHAYLTKQDTDLRSSILIRPRRPTPPPPPPEEPEP